MPLQIPAPRESGYTTTTSVPLYWCRYGDAAATPLVVLHGGPGAHHDYLLPQLLSLATLGGGFDLLFYDQRGGGRSKTDDPTPVTVQTHVDDFVAVCDELGVGGAPLLGYSWGALLALHVVIAGRTPSAPVVMPPWLALVSPAPYLPEDRTVFDAELTRRQLAPGVASLRAELQASGLRERDADAYRQRAFELSVAGYFAHPERSSNLTPFRVTGRVQQSTWASVDGPAVLRALPQVQLPSLVVHGDSDPIPLASAERTAAALGAQFVLLSDCGHVPYVEQPDALQAALEAFVTRQGA
ncbi:MAG TPA: alpha/beta hydrolase [Gemmatimonadaceae bacterium]|nr:alpha/beta hydrolase [Gemmatimonadaceae bacterium]